MTRTAHITIKRDEASAVIRRDTIISNMNAMRAQAAASQLAEVIVQKALAALHDPSTFKVASDSPEAALLAVLKKLPKAARGQVDAAARELVNVADTLSVLHTAESSVALVQPMLNGSSPRAGLPVRGPAINFGGRDRAAGALRLPAMNTRSSRAGHETTATAVDLQFYTAKLVLDKITCKQETPYEPGADEMSIVALHFKRGTQVSDLEDLEDSLLRATIPLGSYRTGQTRKNDVLIQEIGLERDTDIAKERYMSVVTLVEHDISKEMLKLIEILLKVAALVASIYLVTDLRSIAEIVFQVLEAQLSADVFDARWLPELEVSPTEGFGGDQDTKDLGRFDFYMGAGEYRIWLYWELSSHTA